MTDVALIRHTGDSTKITFLTEDGDRYYKTAEEELPKWKMSEIELDKVKTSDRLSNSQYEQYLKAIHTNRGRKLIKQLKNIKANGIINTFLKAEYVRISHSVKSKPKFIIKFIEGLIETELTGKNPGIQKIVSISKREIYDHFVKNKLITT